MIQLEHKGHLIELRVAVIHLPEGHTGGVLDWEDAIEWDGGRYPRPVINDAKGLAWRIFCTAPVNTTNVATFAERLHHYICRWCIRHNVYVPGLNDHGRVTFMALEVEVDGVEGRHEAEMEIPPSGRQS